MDYLKLINCMRCGMCLPQCPTYKESFLETASPRGRVAMVRKFQEGELVESEEMRPKWFHIDEIPFAEMWADDPHWFPLFLRGRKFRGRFLFDEEDKVLEKYLEEVTNF